MGAFGRPSVFLGSANCRFGLRFYHTPRALTAEDAEEKQKQKKCTNVKDMHQYLCGHRSSFSMSPPFSRSCFSSASSASSAVSVCRDSVRSAYRVRRTLL